MLRQAYGTDVRFILSPSPPLLSPCLCPLKPTDIFKMIDGAIEPKLTVGLLRGTMGAIRYYLPDRWSRADELGIELLGTQCM